MSFSYLNIELYYSAIENFHTFVYIYCMVRVTAKATDFNYFFLKYQRKLALGFTYQNHGIERDYVYGVSLTHGQSPRQHIWTFAGTRDESLVAPTQKCPCINTNINPPPAVPSYIGTDYFCDTASSTAFVPTYIQVSDPLWDGEGCGPTNTCCYDPQREVNPPWFVKTLSSPTSDDIEMRLCHPYYNSHGSTPIEIVELYVQ